MPTELAAPLPWVDSHCHFDFAQFDQDRETHWQYLQSMGCAGLIIPGVTAATWPKLIQICANKPWSYALGLHPYFLDQHQPDHIEQLQQMCHTHTPVAIGEFGLDFALPPSTFLAQRNLCEQQFKLAKQHQLPVILHARKAYDEIAAMIRRTHFQQGGIVHAFSGSVQQGHALIKLGFKLGIGGAISHKRAIKLRTTVMQLPLESLVLETDAPDMTPAFLATKRNSPISILLIAHIVASLHKRSLNDVIACSNHSINQVLSASVRYQLL